VRAFSVETLPLGNLSHDNDRQLEDYLRGATVVAWCRGKDNGIRKFG